MEVGKKKPLPLALVVDDDEFFLKFFSRLLEKFGFEAELTRSEPDFIARIKTKTPDICFVDLNIRGTDSGFALVKSIRNKFGDDLPIFVVSGRSDAQAIAHAIEYGATDFILKPVDNEIFATKVGRFFGPSQMNEDELSFIRAPEEGIPAELTLSLDLTAVDEVGATFHAKHLIPRGTVFHAGGDLMAGILGVQRPPMLTVVTTEVQPETDGYQIYAEFEEPTEEVLASIRNWIRRQPAPAAEVKK